MRIEKVWIQNLNSLYGTHEIDFQDAAYQANNLFLICGNTGSGKTTVLDAISLALFGQTPRLDSINKSGNGIMSRGAKNCVAEVTFSVDDKKYRARWAQEINRNGNLNDYTRELCRLVDDKEAEIIETANSKINSKIEEIIGLKYEQFTKAVMLEQGGFAAFMSAKADERAKILEQLTGTDIYTKLSIAAFNREKTEREALEKETDKLKLFPLLSEDDVEKYRTTVEQNNAQVKRIEVEVNQLTEAETWLKQLEKAEKRVQSVKEEAENHRKTIEEFEPTRQAIRLGEKAAKVAPSHQNLLAARKKLKENTDSLETLKKQLPTSENKVQQLVQDVQNKKLNLERVKAEKDAQEPLIQEVRKNIVELNENKKSLEDETKKLNDFKQKYEFQQNALQTCLSNIETINTRIAKANIYFTEHEADQNLIGELANIKTLQKQLTRYQEVLIKTEKASNDVTKQYKDANKNLKSAISSLEKLRENESRCKEKTGICQKNYETALNGSKLEDLEEKRELYLSEKLNRQQIAKLEDLRKELKENCECPLCGSKEHPYCQHAAPQISEIDEKIQQLDKQLKAIRTNKTELEKALKEEQDTTLKRSQAEAAVNALENNVQVYLNAVQEKDRDLENQRTLLTACLKEFAEKVTEYGQFEISVENSENICTTLENNLKTWQKAQKVYDDLQKKMQELDKEKSQFEATSHQLAEQCQQQTLVTGEKTKAVESKYDEIRQKFGDRNVDDEENRLKRLVTEAGNAYESVQKDHSKAAIELEKVKTGIEERTTMVQTSIIDERQCLEVFETELKTQAFSNESEFLSARLEAKKLDELKKKEKSLDEKRIEIDSRLTAALESHQDLQNKSVTTRTLEDIVAEKAIKTAEIQAKHQEIGSITEKLEVHRQNSLKAGEQKKIVDAKTAEHKRWKALSDLIGSGDGKRFRDFAQSITFDILLNKANHYLIHRGLMKRYELIRSTSEKEALDFSIFDYQNGYPRLANNMSGGEKFCLSLSLALALSEMASDRTSIESLFIDEGLGTLDDQTLDVALMMLQNLGDSQKNRLIGLITHVSRAKEAIKTQITAIPQGGGRSKLEGPGCQSHFAPVESSNSGTPAKKKRTKKAKEISE